MNNLVNNPEHKELENDLKALLWKELYAIGDEFNARDFYIKRWGYNPNKYGHIPYSGNHEFQGPDLNKKED